MKINNRLFSISGVKLYLGIILATINVAAWSEPPEGLRHITKDYEAESLDIAFRADGIPSRVRFKACSTCNRLDYKISTAADFYAEGKPVPLNQTRHLNGKSGAVIYNIKKQLVEKIIFF